MNDVDRLVIVENETHKEGEFNDAFGMIKKEIDVPHEPNPEESDDTFDLFGVKKVSITPIVVDD